MTLTQVTKAGLHDIALDHVFTIGASGTDHYTFQGEGLNGTVNDPTLYLTRGKTYRFENGTGAHPIRIQSTSGASGTAYNTGVTNNAGSGTVIVEVQHDAPDVLYYQCTSHANMNGILYITGALADGGVTTAKLADDAVTDAKLANSINTAIAANTAKSTNATHTGDVTGSGSLTIANDAVTYAKIQNVTQDRILGRQSSGSGDVQELNAGNVRLMLNVADGATNSPTTTINNNADNRVITGSGTANTLEGESGLTYNGSTLGVSGSVDDGSTLLKLENNSTHNSQTPSVSIKVDLANGKNGGSIDFIRENNYQSSAAADSSIVFKPAKNDSPTEVVKITQDYVRLNSNASGIQFNSDTAQTNALNDYEEGTWTPVIRRYDNGSWVNATMTTAGTQHNCYYTKIGNVVHYSLGWSGFEVANSSYCVIGGLPFNSTGRGHFVVSYTIAFNSHQNQGGYIGGGGDSQISFYYNNNVWNAWKNNTSNLYLYGTGKYVAA